MRFFPFASVFLVCVAPVRAQEPAQPPVAAQEAPTPTGAPSVRLRFTPGAGSAYKLWMSLTGTMGAGGGEGIPVTGSLNAAAKLTSGKPGQDGSFPVRFQISDLQYSMNGAPASPPDLPKSFEIAGAVDADGVFTPDAKSRDRLAGSGITPGPMQMLEMMLRALVGVPARSLAKGDSWSMDAHLPFGKGDLTVKNTVQSVDDVNGDTVARVQRVMSGPLNVQMSSPIALNITGTVNGTGVVQVSQASGLPVDDASTFKLKMKLNAPDSGAGKMEYTMDMEMKSHVTAVPAAVKPGA
jgi:hypothetical protein